MANHEKQAELVVVVVPFPAQGHLNPLLHLSRLISAYGIPVHFVGTTTHNRQTRLRVYGWDPLSVSNIHFHEFQTPHFISPPPNPNAASTNFPSHLQPSWDASLHLRGPISQLLLTLSPTSKRLVVIHDALMTYVVQDVVSIHNAESYIFRCLSAFYTFCRFWEKMGRPFQVEPELLKSLPSREGCFTPEFAEFVKLQHAHQNFHSGNLYDSCRLIEGQFLDFLEKEEIMGKTKLWAIGPFNPVEISDTKSSPNRHKCLDWLDKQDSNSVIYVSFGTTTSFTDEQIKELAFGLEKSEQKFIWVLRDADKGDVFRGKDRRVELPEGYEERVKRGMVVREWVPQLDILGHPATGGFISHCGWNSSMESITMGVPIATWPMHSDQPRNAFLITNILKIGLVVKDWARRVEIVTSLVIEVAVRKLMGSNEGDEIRKRAVELGGAVRRSVKEGGVTRAELDSFISNISR